MNENSYQKLAELIEKAPRLLGPGGLFGGLNQEHGLMVDFVKFARGLKLGNNMSPEKINISNFVDYLGERENAEEVARKLYDMRQNGEIVDDPHVKAKNTLLNLAETLIDLGVGEKPENVGGDYEKILRETLSSHSDAGIGAKTDEKKLYESAPGQKGPGNMQNSLKEQPREISKGEREIASTETPLSTMGESLTDEVSIAQGEEDQAGALAIGAETQTGALAIGRAEAEGRLLSEEKSEIMSGKPATAPKGATPQTPAPAPGRDVASPETPLSIMPSDEGNLQSEAAEISGDISFRDSGLLRPLTAPMTGEIVGEAGAAAGQAVGQEAGQAASRPAGQATGEALAGTRAAPGGERRRIVAELPGEGRGRMLQEGSKKHGQTQEQGRGQSRGAGESERNQGRQTGPGRNPAQDFADSQAAQQQKSRVVGKVAGGAGIAGSLALIKGMYGGAAANAASFGILQTILDFLT